MSLEATDMDATSEFEPTDEDLRHIRQWLSKMPHLVQDYDDNVLKSVFIATKGRLQKTKKTLERFNSLGYTYPLSFGHLDPLNEITQYYLDCIYLFPMPKRTNDGTCVLIGTSRKKEIDGNKFSPYELNRYLIMTFMILTYEKLLGESKFIVIYDCHTITVSQIRLITPSYLRELLMLSMGFPIRLQSAHLVNVPSFYQPVLTLMKAMAPKKASERIHFHSAMEELHYLVPKKCLPKDYGGYDEDLETLNNAWRRKVEGYRHRLIEESDKMRKLDRLRPKSNENQELQGSFRRLQID